MLLHCKKPARLVGSSSNWKKNSDSLKLNCKRGEKPCRGRLETIKIGNNGSSRTNNRIPNKTRQDGIV